MTSDIPTIQRATLDDYESVARLHFLSHTVSFAPFVSERWLNSRRLDDYLSRWREALGSAVDGDSTLIAWIGGEAVGMVRVAQSAAPGSRTDVNSAQLTSMHVVPGLTGKGIGTLLMQRSLDYIREQNFSRVVLGVIAANTGARRFYEFHGWVLVEELPNGVEGVPVAIYELA
ncbi:MAG: GNAT family N-acetyltransferase [Chloroflexi bacterium]|nr:GNAT family N-acetyltransferase [Chloroflexota bacterium]